MKLTSTNFLTEDFIEFYKATQSGVQKCILVDNMAALEDRGINPYDSPDFVWGYVCESMFIRLRENTPADLFHLDHKQNGFFTEETEAVDFHRTLVLEYIENLNNSTLKSNPIKILPYSI